MKIISVSKDRFLKEFPDTEEDINNCILNYSEEKGLGIIKYPNGLIISKVKKGFDNQEFTQQDDFDLLISITNGGYEEIKKEVEQNLYEIQAIEELEYDDPLENGYKQESKIIKVKRIVFRGTLILGTLLVIYGTYVLSGLLNK